MNKIGFAFSGILIIIGIVTLLTTSIINAVLPKLGRAAFQAAMAGSYSPSEYLINFWGINFAALLLIGLGVFSGYRFFQKEAK